MSTVATPSELQDPLYDRQITLPQLAELWESYPVKPGTVVQVTLTSVDASEVGFNVGELSGLIAASEFAASPKAVGDSVDVLVEQIVGSTLRASYAKAQALSLFDQIELAARSDATVPGTVTARVQGGVSVDIGLKAFLPERKPTIALGETTRFWVRGWDDRKDLFVLAREPRSSRESRAATSPAREVDGVEHPATLPRELPEVGAVLTGRVARLSDFGAFVDLPGGATGLLHIKDMSHARALVPSDVVEIGDEIQVKVLEVKAGDTPRGDKIRLSLKALEGEPWALVMGSFAIGQRVSGKVVGFAEFGAFVELKPGIEAMVHVSEITWDGAPKHPKDALALEQLVEGEIIHLDAEKRQIKLSIKKLAPSPWATLRDRFPVGTRVMGTIKKLADFGLFVSLDPATDLQGLVHVNDVSWDPRGLKRADFKVGTEIEVVVLAIEEDRGRCSLGIKQLTPEPVRASLSSFVVGQTLEVVIARIKDFGAFAELAPGLDGLLHANQMGLEEGQKPSGVLNVGDRVTVTIASVDPETRRVGLALIPKT